MKIEIGDVTVTFCELKPGDAFTPGATKDLYIKATGTSGPDSPNAVRLSDGRFDKFHNDNPVVLRHVKVVREER